jgi:hypothetical protein
VSLTCHRARELKTAQFGFSFNTFAPKFAPTFDPAIPSPPRRSPKKSPKKSSLAKVSPVKIPLEETTAATKATSPAKPSLASATSKKRKIKNFAEDDLPNATTKRRKITTARNETKTDVPEVQVVGATTIQYEDQMLAEVKDEIPPAEVSRNKVKSNTVPKKRGRPARKDKALEIEHLVEVGSKINVKEEEAANQHQGAPESHQPTDLTDVPGTSF